MPSADSSSSISRVAVPLPFVPTTWIDGYARCGSPSSRTRACIRSRPNSFGHGESCSSQLTGERVELTAVPLELLALAVDDVRRRALHEPLVGEHPFGPRDLVLQALDLRGDVPVRLLPDGLDDGFEDPRLLA